jgi:hypothetical protein
MKGTLARLASILAGLVLVLMAGSPAIWAAAATPSLPTTPRTGPSTSLSKEPTPVRNFVAEPSIITGPLINNGGPVQTAPIVYVVYWGWTSDPSGEQAYLNDFLSTVGGTAWLGTVTQYSGAGNPTGLYAGSWSDPSSVPTQPSDAQIQAEALSAVQHFGLGTSVNIQVVVATPTGHSTPNFGVAGGFCAYHGKLASYPNVTYTDLPYMTDAGTACGANSVSGPLDGVSIVAGHELAESITDPLLNAWLDASGNEIADKCAWTDLSTIATSLGNFAVQPLWSNAANGCVLSSVGVPSVNDGGGPAGCRGLYIIEWTAVANATTYNILVNRPPYSGYVQTKSVTGTETTITAQNAPGATLVEVQACTATACGADSSPLLLSYYAGCP